MESSKQVLLTTLEASLLLDRPGLTQVRPRPALGLDRPILLDAKPARLPSAAWLPTDDAVEDPLR